MDRQYIGRYRIVGQLGKGGMGTVLRAFDEVRQREVAIKLPNETDPETISRLQRECDVLAQLQHHNIVQVYGSGSEPDLPFYIVMEYVEGTTVEDLLRQQQGPLEPRRALKIALGVAEALAYAHKPPLRVIHRDIKPGNILIRSGDSVVKVTDFGIAAVLSEHTGRTAIGTMAYMAPEQAMGQGVDERTDLYSLGAMLYEMLTGQRPPQLASAPARLPSAVTGMQALSPDLSARVDRLVLSLLESSPARRVPQRAADLVEEIRAILDGRPSRLSSGSQPLAGSLAYQPTQRANLPPTSANLPPGGILRSAPPVLGYPQSAPPGPQTGYGAYPAPTSVPYPPYAPSQPVMVNVMQQVGQQQYAAAPLIPVVIAPPSSGKATASLVLGIIGLVMLACFGIGAILGLLAVIFGHVALGEIRRSSGRLRGVGSAIAGLIMGYLSIAVGVLVLLAIAHR